MNNFFYISYFAEQISFILVFFCTLNPYFNHIFIFSPTFNPISIMIILLPSSSSPLSIFSSPVILSLLSYFLMPLPIVLSSDHLVSHVFAPYLLAVKPFHPLPSLVLSLYFAYFINSSLFIPVSPSPLFISSVLVLVNLIFIIVTSYSLFWF